MSRVDYSFGGFDWSGGADITKGLGGVASSSSGSESLPGGAAGSSSKSVSSSRQVTSLHATHSNGQTDYVQTQRVLLARSRVLGKEIQRVRRLAAATAASASATTTTAATVTMTSTTAASVDEDCTQTMMTVEQQSSTATAASPFPSPFRMSASASAQGSTSAHTLTHGHSQSSFTPQTNGGSQHSSATITATPPVPVARCTDMALALTWQDIATELLQVPESLLNQDTLTVIENNLRDAGRFFELDLGPEDERWAEFMRLQQVPWITCIRAIDDLISISMPLHCRRRC